MTYLSRAISAVNRLWRRRAPIRHHNGEQNIIDSGYNSTSIAKKHNVNLSKCGIVMAEFGPQADQCFRTILSLQRHVELPVIVYSDTLTHAPVPNVTFRQVTPPDWGGHHRAGWRANDLYQSVALLDSPYETTLYLDGDMYFPSSAFIQGFALAKQFGVCVPQNPRVFQRVEIQVGADVDAQDRAELQNVPDLGMAFNMSPMFVHGADPRAKSLLETYRLEMERKPCRGPLALWKAVWSTGIFPCVLPLNWCVGKAHVGMGNEIVLHGQPEVRKYYGLQ